MVLSLTISPGKNRNSFDAYNPATDPIRVVKCTWCSSAASFTYYPEYTRTYISKIIKERYGNIEFDIVDSPEKPRIPTKECPRIAWIVPVLDNLAIEILKDRTSPRPNTCWACATMTVLDRINMLIPTPRPIERRWQWRVSVDEGFKAEYLTLEKTPYRYTATTFSCSVCKNTIYFTDDAKMHNIWEEDNKSEKTSTCNRKILWIEEDKIEVELVHPAMPLPTVCRACEESTRVK